MDETSPGWQAELPDGWLVLTVDRLPAWMLGPWGATWVPTPTLCQLAAKGLCCDRLLVRSTAPADTLTELAEARLPLVGPQPAGPLAAAAARGWRVAVVTDVADQAAALTASPATPETVVVPPRQPRRTADSDETSGCGRVVSTAAAILERGDVDMLWCHLGSLGTAWDAPQACREACFDPDDPPPDDAAVIPDFPVAADTDPDRVMTARQVFAGELAHLDDWLDRLMGAARQRWQRFGLLFIGLRGLPLGLHGRVGPGDPEPAPYAELTQVPAVLIDPAGRQAAQRFGGLLLPADLGATLGELISGESVARPPAGSRVAGHSLVSLLAGDAAAWRAWGRDRVVSQSGGGRAITVAEWTLVQPTGAPPRLFAKPDDLFELADVADRSRDIAAALADCLADPGCQLAAWEKPLPKLLSLGDSADR